MNDDIFNALAHERRRRLLLDLLEEHHESSTHGPAVSDGGTGRDAARHRAEMHHTHLPKLDHYGIIEWHEDTGEISRGPNFEEVRPLLQLVAEHPD